MLSLYLQIVLGVIQFFVVSLGGLAIGVILGALTSFITKYTEHCRGEQLFYPAKNTDRIW